MKNFVMIFVFLMSNFAMAMPGFVGNGGNGVDYNGQLYVQDLFSYNVHKVPYFGKSIDSELPVLPSFGFDYPQEMLRRKLTDLNAGATGMGDFVLSSMKKYTWVLIDFPLVPIVDSDDPVELPSGAQLVQIANRYGDTIRIYRAAWDRLDDANKVALLIHEGIYSLVRPVSSGKGIFKQSARSAREVTAAFFTEGFYKKDSPEVLASLRGVLAIPTQLFSLKDLRRPPEWTMVYQAYRVCNESWEGCSVGPSQLFLQLHLSQSLRPEVTNRHISQFCFLVKEKVRQNPKVFYKLRSTLFTGETRADLLRYKPSLDSSDFQYYVNILAMHPGLIDNLVDFSTFDGMDDCETVFLNQLRNITYILP